LDGKYIDGDLLKSITDMIKSNMKMLNKEHVESFKTRNLDKINVTISKNYALCEDILKGIKNSGQIKK